jgi:hypothetical protein
MNRKDLPSCSGVAGEAARYPSVGAAVGGGGGSEGGWTEEDEPREEDKGAMRVRWFTRLCLRVHAVYQGGGRGGGGHSAERYGESPLPVASSSF